MGGRSLVQHKKEDKTETVKWNKMSEVESKEVNNKCEGFAHHLLNDKMFRIRHLRDPWYQ